MAASLLRLGRVGSLKCLRLETWSVLRRAPAAALCTKADEPKKTPKKAKAPSKKAAPAPPEPEPEPFDNSTYKNLQHHHYHLYTFVDMDVEMAKFRLPQPSSGRPSPRH
ncbi:NADH dehydrogenase [ubiquinone] flavoprotein 3, mitochondrial [Megalops cyprinoides]|uniref:NADH dehydrogenase [ubiquinone] flavoprotein 3, mitochondrial n=1 Tax=Megalops cyprinoides TaxID=118141 RepID=UPI001864787C|nr:NADH dehydrogenase [ubiquinone] flavoprotein 3, mitochondrial [Megalops cyprinoides]